MGSPSFFKIVLQSAIDEEKLDLPRKFARKHGNELATKATLIVPDGKTWKIMIGKKSDGTTWLSRGWSEFAAYYSIKYSYLMVFKYKGNSIFHVRIFAPNSYEIRYPTCDHTSPNVTVNYEDEGESGARIETTVATSFRQIRRKATPSGERTIRAATELNLKKPSFMLVMQQYNLAVPVAYVPGKFANEHLSPDCSHMIVRYSSSSNSNNNKEWVIRLNWRKRGGLNFGLGWGVFKADNDLKPEDVCLFELVNPREGVMKVHIFRASCH
ncbi:B3 domain-containing transcription factor VRN1 [Linum perenne]